MTKTTKAGAEVAKREPAAAIPQARSVLQSMATRYHCNGELLLSTLKNTVFKNATNEQLMALCIVADQYRLNPFTKEIYAFPDKKTGGIVPVVGIDGWLRIINDHPQFDGMDVEGDDIQCEATIYRKDRQHPTKATEYMSECKRNTDPWNSHPQRMLRHKAIIQCARMAFGFALKDPDEAERIIAGETAEVRVPVDMPRVIEAQAVPEEAAPAAQDEAQEPPAADLPALIAEVTALIEKAKPSKIQKAMQAVGIAWDEGEEWTMAGEDKIRSLASLLKC